MKKQLLPLFASAWLALPLLGAADEPILNLEVQRHGDIEDVSTIGRTFSQRGIESSHEPKACSIQRSGAITISYDESDPLFSDGDCTWILHCRLLSPTDWNSAYSLAGRWKTSDNDRVIALAVNGPDGKARFSLSNDGHARPGSITGAHLPDSVPTGEWIYLVGTFKAGQFLSLEMYDSSGYQLSEVSIYQYVPEKLFSSEAPFSMGSPREAGLEFKSFRVWDEALSSSSVKAALSE